MSVPATCAYVTVFCGLSVSGTSETLVSASVCAYARYLGSLGASVTCARSPCLANRSCWHAQVQVQCCIMQTMYGIHAHDRLLMRVT